ncbi:MAG: hypothetical protein P4M07_06325 [Xanthobacteraceae bacterium]|nr:hypothetical protein [Xanthobacteraceae bacterium]
MIEIPFLLQIHIILSLVGILSGLVVAYGWLTGRPLAGWTALFLATTALTSITGFPLPPFGFDPARVVGALSLILLAVAALARYRFDLSGAWRPIYVGTACAALYLNVFVAVVQSFQKLPAVHALAPTQSEPPFLIAQVVVLAAFVALGVIAALRFHPSPGGATLSPMRG